MVSWHTKKWCQKEEKKLGNKPFVIRKKMKPSQGQRKADKRTTQENRQLGGVFGCTVA